jgi:hypothetical protein
MALISISLILLCQIAFQGESGIGRCWAAYRALVTARRLAWREWGGNGREGMGPGLTLHIMGDGRVDRPVARAGPPQIRTCAINASGSSCEKVHYANLSRTRRSRNAGFSPARLSVEFSLTRSRVPVHPSCRLPTVLLARLALSSTGSAWTAFPCFIGTIASSDSLPSFRSPRYGSAVRTTYVSARLLPPAARHNPRGPGTLGAASPFPLARFRWRWQGLPGSWGAPVRTCPALRPRRDLGTRPARCSGVAFRRLEDVGSRNAVISGLNHTACTLAVYASQRRLPDATQDSLPVGGQPFPRGIGYPPGSLRNFTSSSA